jgi:hypothetical protein
LKKRQTKLSIALTVTLVLTVSLLIGGFTPKVSAQTSPTITINNGTNYTNSTALTLTLSSSNATQMRFSNDNLSWSDWENFTTSENWTLPTTEGNVTVYAQFIDSDNNTFAAIANIVLDTTAPVPQPYAEWYSNDYRTVYFDSSYSTDNIGIANSTWNFGDGNTTSGIALIHTYTAAGNYTGYLTVEDFAGNTANVSFSANIPDLTASPTATPTPYPTVPPTTNPTYTPTPTAQPTQPPTDLDQTNKTIIIIAAIVAVGIVLAVVVIVFWKRWSKAPPPPPTVS